MRPIDLGVVVAIGLSSVVATAGPRGGHGGEGGGPLSSTSSGLGDAARRGGGGGGSGPIVTSEPERSTVYVEDTRPPTVMVGGETVVVVKRRQRPTLPMPKAHFEGYVGASKVVDSDESFTAEVGVVDDWFRVDGSYTRYYEAQQLGMPMLQLSMPKITGGVRVYEQGAKIYVTGGVVGAKTKNDPTMDSSFVGAVAGVRLDTPLGDLATLVGNAELNIFSDHVTATSVCAGVKVGPLQASLRLLDFNVGPPLYGPELGLRF